MTHRAADMLGLGHERRPGDPGRRGLPDPLDALRAAIARRPRRPASARSRSSPRPGRWRPAPIDPLDEIADLCEAEGLWFHVDGAYGGPAVFADDLRPLFAGIERADSIAFDPHKWMYIAAVGGLRAGARHAALADSFSADASYIYRRRRTLRAPDLLGLFGPQFSRGFQALKVWVSLLAHGRARYAARISHDAALARYLGARVEERPDFELSTPVALSICCFRFVPPGLPPVGAPGREEYLDELNERLMTESQLDGRVFFSNAVLGREALRPAGVHRELPDRGRGPRRRARRRGRDRFEARRRASPRRALRIPA